MGLGKTVQALSLIVTNHADVAAQISSKEAIGSLSPSRGTLIVCPLSVLVCYSHYPPPFSSLARSLTIPICSINGLLKLRNIPLLDTSRYVSLLI